MFKKLFGDNPEKEEEKKKIYTLLRSDGIDNLDLAILLAKSQQIRLTAFWQALFNYYNARYNHFSRMESYKPINQLIKASPNQTVNLWSNFPDKTKAEILNILNETNITIYNKSKEIEAFINISPYCQKLQRIRLSGTENRNFPSIPPTLQELNISRMPVDQIPIDKIIHSNINDLALSDNPLLSGQQVWEMALKMPKLKVLKWAGGKYSFAPKANNKLEIDYSLANFLYPENFHIPQIIKQSYTSIIITAKESRTQTAQLKKSYSKYTDHVPKAPNVNHLPKLLGTNFENINKIHLQGTGWNWKTYFSWAKQFPKLTQVRCDVTVSRSYYFSDNTHLTIDRKEKKLSIIYGQHASVRLLWRNFIREAANFFADEIEHIHIKANHIVNYLPSAICQFKNLKTLHLAGLTKLKTLPKDWATLQHLEEVNMSNNPQIDWEKLLPKFKKLPNLKTLNLSNNKLEKLPDAITKIKSLKSLDLSKNHLTTLPDHLLDLPNLYFLSLHDNALTTLPIIHKSSVIQKLSLQNNRLETLHPSIARLHVIRTLNLDNNRLNTIPKQIYWLSSLTNLSIVHNNISELPDSFSVLNHLVELDISNNHIKHIPNALSQLKRIRKINLSNNKIETIPDAFFSSELQRLDLSRNCIKTLHADFNMPLMSQLYLNNNPLTNLPKGLEKSNVLSTLDLSHTDLASCAHIPLQHQLKISLINTKIQDWSHLYFRRTTDFDRLKIQWLTKRQFPTNGKKVLDLRNQKIKDWGAICRFIQEAKFEEVQLQKNNIRLLDEGFANCHDLKSIFLQENPNLDCLNAAQTVKDLNLKFIYFGKDAFQYDHQLKNILGDSVSIRYSKK